MHTYTISSKTMMGWDQSSPSRGVSLGKMAVKESGAGIFLPCFDHSVAPSQKALTPSSFSDIHLTYTKS